MSGGVALHYAEDSCEMRAGSVSGQSQGGCGFLVILEEAFLLELSPPLAAPAGGSPPLPYCPQPPPPTSVGPRAQAPELSFHASDGHPPLWHSYRLRLAAATRT